MENYNNVNNQGFEQQPYQFQKPKKSGCGGCFGCFVGCFFVVIILAVISIGYGYYWANTSGRNFMAYTVDQMVNDITSDPSFKDEKAKIALTTKAKEFSNKIRNKEITWGGIFKGFSLLDKDGFRERIALFSFFVATIQTDVGVTEEERVVMMRALKGIYDGKIESIQLAVFKSMLDNASFAKINSYDANNVRTLNKEKMHQALNYLKSFVEEKELENITEDNFKFEQYVTTEAVRIMNGFIEGSEEANKIKPKSLSTETGETSETSKTKKVLKVPATPAE